MVDRNCSPGHSFRYDIHSSCHCTINKVNTTLSLDLSELEGVGQRPTPACIGIRRVGTIFDLKPLYVLDLNSDNNSQPMGAVMAFYTPRVTVKPVPDFKNSPHARLF